ncbi:MAG: helix-hairpin-helix domain-containing protein, partial [Chloroflexota bacterium]
NLFGFLGIILGIIGVLRSTTRIFIPTINKLFNNFFRRGTNFNDLNEANLEKIPGIGKTLAKKITDSRAKDGPFTDIKDLRSRIPTLRYRRAFETIEKNYYFGKLNTSSNQTNIHEESSQIDDDNNLDNEGSNE